MREPDLLRFLTAGSVDDGKSTLIGRLLHDSHSIYQDQIASIRGVAAQNGNIDFALVTDGLRAEREQGITIDVAYRHFSTPRRRFIVADTPGHEQYTRNMATGASTADAAVLLMDARKGVLPQTQRHAAIAWLLGIRQLAIVVNKMDLAGFDEGVFRAVEADLRKFLAKLTGASTYFLPVCSVDGDNVVSQSTRMPWFKGAPLLQWLETVPVPEANLGSLRFPVQNVIRSANGSRLYAGRVASGILRRDDSVQVMSSGSPTRISSIRIGGREVDAAAPPLSISIALEDELDISRSDMIAGISSPPICSRRFVAALVWMNAQPLEPGRPYLLKHTTRQVCATITKVKAVIEPASMEQRAAETLRLNEFGRVEVETHQPLFIDPYRENRATGAFIVIDPLANATLAAGMIEANAASRSPLTFAEGSGLAVWFTGLSSAGKSTISKAVYEKLWAKGYRVDWLDADVIRQQLNKGLGFSKEDRDENVRRIGFLAEMLARNGVIALVSAISPYRAIRNEVRQRIGNFIEVYVHAPLEVCEHRDLKGIYRRARAGELKGVTGIDDPYEPPLQPELECRTDRETPAESTARVIAAIEAFLDRPTNLH